jgi:hypothetical protein
MIEASEEAPQIVPQPGRPVHHISQPSRGVLGGRYSQQQPAAKASSKSMAHSRSSIGAGVRQANYQP